MISSSSRADLKRLAILTAAGFALLFLLTWHASHLLRLLPYGFLLLCPLMHLFMHKGHGHHARMEEEMSGNPSGADVR